MVAYTANNINQEFTLADGDTLLLDMPYPVRIVVAAVSTDVTVGIEVIKDSGNYRAMSPVVTTTTTLNSNDIWPPKTRYNFTGGGAEVKVYGV